MGKENTPVLIPMDLEEFFDRIRQVVREEWELLSKEKKRGAPLAQVQTPGLTYKPLYDIKEVRSLFSNVSRSTIYEWIKEGSLKPVKIKGKGKVFFLWADIEKLWVENGAKKGIG